MEHFIKNVKQFRGRYNEIKIALPWLDASVWENDKAIFDGFIRNMETPYVKSTDLELSLKGRLSGLKKDNINILRFNPEKGPLDSYTGIISEMIENNIPLAILHTDINFDEIISFAGKNISLKIIIESGPRKILYLIEKVKETLKKCENVYLCTYNFCNWLGHEQLCEMGFGKRLLYGSHMPRYSSDASMGPIIMSQLDWKTKCEIAGNNLRQLLGMELLKTKEMEYIPPEPFIIDSHAHNLQPGKNPVYPMPTPDLNFSPEDWVNFMDLCAVVQMYMIPGEVLFDSKICCRDYIQGLINFRAERFYYYEIYNPAGNSEHIEKLEKSLKDPKCIGIKIHPVTHKTSADDDKYALVYKLAEKYKKPIMTHSWEISSYNPEQYRSHPDKFRRFLEIFREVPFILGHAGGRPGTFDATVKVCLDFPNVYVDLAGDYYDNGLIDILVDRIGPGKILFASDVDWIDTRCNLAPVLASGLRDNDVLKILRLNALRVFQRGE